VAIIPSYFGELAASENLQFIVDQSQDILGQASIWRNYLTLGTTQMDLHITSVIGRDRISAMASVVDTDAPAPLRSRNKVDRYSGTIPTMKEKFRLSQKEMRDIELLRLLPQVNGNALANFLKRDVQEAAVAGDKRVDFMMLQGVSNLAIDLTTTYNPDGVPTASALDLLPYYGTATQKQGVPIVWSSSSTATPIDDIENFININRNNRGRTFAEIWMSNQMWLAFKKTTQVKNNLQTFYNVGKANASFSVTQSNVNDYLQENGWPPIRIINYTSMLEVDGMPTYVQGFNPNNVVFIPAGPLGELANAYSMEDLNRVAGKNYAKSGSTRVSVWRTDDPLAEFTGMEMLAFPVLNVDGIFILTTDQVQATFI
jgi:hypothetical protein